MRKLAAAAFSFAGGIALSQYLLPARWQLPLCALTAALGLLGLLRRGNARLRIFLIAGGLAAAMGYNWLYAALVQSPAELLAGTERSGLSMTVCDYPRATNYGARVTVTLHIQGLRGGKAVYYGGEELLTLVPGNRITGDAALESAAKIREEDVTTFTSRGVFLLAYRRGEVTVEPGNADSVRWWPARMGQAMRNTIGTLYRGDAAGFLTAILTGDKSGLSQGAQSDLSEAGLYHILAVSGMHCAFLLALVTFFTGRQRLRLTAAVAAPVLLFYMVLAGATPSVVRSCVMLLFLLAAPLLGRKRDSATALAAALAVILLANPFAIASVSLQLSFAAVAGLLAVTPRLNRLLNGEAPRGRVRRFVTLSVSASVGALAFTTPLTAIYFNTLSLVSPLSNLACLWAAGAVFSLGLLSVLAGLLFPPLGAVLSLPVRALIWYLLKAAAFLAGLPYHALHFDNPYLKDWLVFAYLLAALAYVLKRDSLRTWGLTVGLAAATLAATVFLGARQTAYGALNATVLDVGQGESIVLSSGGRFALIDCGTRYGDAGGAAADALESMGCRELSYLLLTHYDADHVSGVETLLHRMPVSRLLAPDTEDDSGLRQRVLAAAERYGAAVSFVTEETAVSLGEAAVRAYPPLGTEGDNQLGLTFLCSAGDYDLLVTGDMDAATERTLLETYPLPDIEALVAGHHGSRSSTSKELLEALRPEAVLISVGSNSYGHPAGETLRRLVRFGAAIYRTDLQGDLKLTVN